MVMQARIIEFYAEVRQVGRSSGFCPFVSLVVPAPINIVEPDYNSGEDLDYEEKSSYHRTEEDEVVPNTPTLGDLDTKHVQDPTMECVSIEYNTDEGVEFMVGHTMRNRVAVIMVVKNYSIRSNAEFRVPTKPSPPPKHYHITLTHSNSNTAATNPPHSNNNTPTTTPTATTCSSLERRDGSKFSAAARSEARIVLVLVAAIIEGLAC
ncbi:hypothetical protein PIB30_011772 [Stylosanthes scabra]|uniref:Uncharacterized protein n=1 Tax=Stylosanthes scabra TaxID=79078 RepID=A0ABU6Q6P4_9FABA|nr:hypothetical protein [Stylosanthes scabra]